jgi:hypothetical protein
MVFPIIKNDFFGVVIITDISGAEDHGFDSMGV